MKYEEAVQRYVQQRQKFDGVVRAAFAIDARVATVPASPKAFVGAMLVTKALGHAIAIGKTAPQLEDERPFYDFLSVAVLLRALAETYLTFRYASIEPTTEEELNFRDALMDYHHCCKHLELIQDFRPEGVTIEHATGRKDEALKRLQANRLFQAQDKNSRDKQLKGKEFAHRSLTEIATAAGLHPSAWSTIWIYLSQIIHTAPMTLKHMAAFSGEEARAPRTLYWLLSWSSGFLAKQLVDFEALYPGSLGALLPEDARLLTEQASAVDGVRPQDLNEDGDHTDAYSGAPPYPPQAEAGAI